MARRHGAAERNLLAVLGNLATTYDSLGRHEEALPLRRSAYSGYAKFLGNEHVETLCEANNYAHTLLSLRRFEETKSLLRKNMPVARRVFGDSDEDTLRMRWNYAMALSEDPAATLDDLREAVTTLEDAGRTARRVLGGAHPTAVGIEKSLQKARAALRGRA